MTTDFIYRTVVLFDLHHMEREMIFIFFFSCNWNYCTVKPYCLHTPLAQTKILNVHPFHLGKVFSFQFNFVSGKVVSVQKTDNSQEFAAISSSFF